MFAEALCPQQRALVGHASVLLAVFFLIAAVSNVTVPQHESSSKTELLNCT